MRPIYTIREKEEDRLVFRADGREMPVPYGNALRRFLFSRLPVVAVNSASVRLSAEEGFDNGTSDDDEMLRRQISWIPLIVPLGEEERLVFRVCDPDDRQRPLVNRSVDTSVLVTCRDVRVERDGEPVDPGTVFAHLDFPITSLGYGESILCEFRAVAGAASENSHGRRATEFQPICVAAMRYELTPEKEVDGFRIPDEQDYVKLENNAPAGLVWTLELATTPSTYTCARAIETALGALVAEVERLRRAWTQRDEVLLRVEEETEGAINMYWLNVDGYSLLGMVQHAFNEVVAEDGRNGNTHFCGFRETHPLEKQMQVTVLVPPGSGTSAAQLFGRALDRVLQRCTTLLAAWRKEVKT